MSGRFSGVASINRDLGRPMAGGVIWKRGSRGDTSGSSLYSDKSMEEDLECSRWPQIYPYPRGRGRPIKKATR